MIFAPSAEASQSWADTGNGRCFQPSRAARRSRCPARHWHRLRHAGSRELLQRPGRHDQGDAGPDDQLSRLPDAGACVMAGLSPGGRPFAVRPVQPARGLPGPPGCEPALSGARLRPDRGPAGPAAGLAGQPAARHGDPAGRQREGLPRARWPPGLGRHVMQLALPAAGVLVTATYGHASSAGPGILDGAWLARGDPPPVCARISGQRLGPSRYAGPAGTGLPPRAVPGRGVPAVQAFRGRARQRGESRGASHAAALTWWGGAAAWASTPAPLRRWRR